MGRAKGASGGVGNEAGSLHRAGFAAYAAAHGLTGKTLAGLGVPKLVVLETSASVDDIAVTFVNGTGLFASAKRSCGNDKHFRATVAQWVAAAGTLRAGDRLGLVVQEAKGPIKDLGAALERRRSAHDTVFSTDQINALEALDAAMPAGTTPAIAEKVRDAAVVLILDTAPGDGAAFREAGYALENLLVGHDQGLAAVRAMRDSFHEQAATGSGSGVDEWLDALEAAKLSVFRDGDGPAGPRRAAERAAVTAHRAQLAAQRGLVEFGLLSDGLPPMRYDSLADRMQVLGADAEDRTQQTALLPLARAWPRLLLVGLPGMGKSAALREIAGGWAADPKAPLPIHVRLSALARTSPSTHTEVSLSLLLEAAASAANAENKAPLRRAMADALHVGGAALLLDGLDECRRFTGVIADALVRIFEEVHPDTTVIVSCRESASAAAAKLGFPATTLAGLGPVDSLPDKVLHHYAKERIGAAEQGAWLLERSQWLESARRSGRALWDVPLMAILMTLAVASGVQPSRVGVAQLLSQALDASVRQWEIQRALTTNAGVGLDAAMVLDGFEEIAYAIATSAQCPAVTAHEAVAAMLREKWGKPPSSAIEAARDVVAFWVEHMGAFVVDPQHGGLEGRSQVFVEIGEAKRAAALDHAGQRNWLARCAAEGVTPETLILAAGLNEDLAIQIMDLALTHNDRGLLVAVADALGDRDTSPATLGVLINRLADCGGKPATSSTLSSKATSQVKSLLANIRQAEGPVWPCARELAMLHLPVDLRVHRDTALASLELSDDQRLVAQALTVFGDAAFDQRDTLTTAETEVVRRALNLPISDDKGTSRSESRRHLAFTTPPPILSGRVELAERAAPHVGSLGDGALVQVKRTITKGGFFQAVRAQQRLSRAGQDVGDLLGEQHDTFKNLADLFGNVEECFGTVLSVIARLSGVPAIGHSSLTRQWRKPDLLTFSNIIGLPDDCQALYADRDNLPDILGILARVYEVDVEAVVQQAAHAAETIAEDRAHLAAPLWMALPEPDASVLTAADIPTLVEALDSPSDRIAHLGLLLLERSAMPGVVSQVRERVPNMSPIRRRDAWILVAWLTSDRIGLCVELLQDDDPAARAAAGWALRAPSDDPRVHDLRASALIDNDMTVRLAASASQEEAEAATIWSCATCGTYNTITALDCGGCQRGTRPGERPALTRKQVPEKTSWLDLNGSRPSP